VRQRVLTVVVYKVCHADAEKSRIEAGVQTEHPLALYYSSSGIESGCFRARGLDLCACGKCDEGVSYNMSVCSCNACPRTIVRHSHGQKATSRTSECVCDIVTLLSRSSCRYGLCGLGRGGFGRLRHCKVICTRTEYALSADREYGISTQCGMRDDS